MPPGSPELAGLFGIFLFLTYYLQQTLGYSPVTTGLAHRLLHRPRLERHRRKHHHQLPHVRKGENGVDKLKIGIIFGGCSEEHPVSVKSAQEVAKHLDLGKHEPLWIGITTSGAWKLCDGPGANWESHGNRPVVLSPDRSVRERSVIGLGIRSQGASGEARP
jgi:hypothetical protein